MKTLKATTLLVFFLAASNVFGQLKVVRFGMKGGMNLPRQTLSLNDINNIVNDQTYDISNIQTEFIDGFNIGMITRVSLPLIPVYVHGEALYTQFDETIAITDGGTDFTINSTVQRLDFPISAGAKIGPAFAGLGATPSIPFANRSDLWTPDVERAARVGDRVETGTVFLNRADYLDPGLCWTGIKDTGRGGGLSVIGYHNLTRPKSYHLKKVTL